MQTKNKQLAIDVLRPNLLQNGGFELWPQGVGGLGVNLGPANWMSSAGQLTTARDGINADAGGSYCCAATVAAIAGTPELQHYAGDPTYRNLGQLDLINEMVGRTYVYAMRIKTAVANGVRLCVYDNINGRTLFSQYHTGNGQYQTLAMAYTVPVGCNTIIPIVRFEANGLYYLDNAVFTYGTVVNPPAYSPDAAMLMPNARLGADVYRGNLLTNPGFERWSRGAGPFTTGGAYGPDRWNCQIGAGTLSVTRIASTIGQLGGYSMQMAAAPGGAYVQVNQPMGSTGTDMAAQLAGQLVTFSVLVKCSIVGGVRLKIWDGVAAVAGAANLTTGAERISVTALMAGNPPSQVPYVTITCDNGTCTVECNDATLVPGNAPGAYAPLHIIEENLRCWRYYEFLSPPFGGMWANTALTVYLQAMWRTDKAASPVMTYVVANAIQPMGPNGAMAAGVVPGTGISAGAHGVVFSMGANAQQGTAGQGAIAIDNGGYLLGEANP